MSIYVPVVQSLSGTSLFLMQTATCFFAWENYSLICKRSEKYRRAFYDTVSSTLRPQ